MSERPLLSICIPTYNRAEYLAKSLDSLICLPEFNTSEVEVVISDNASTDNTQKIVKIYTDRYNTIHYYRNEENIRDKNFPTSITRANGTFRKLCNDTLIYSGDYLAYLLYNIKTYQKDRPFLFFPNHNLGKKQKDQYECTDINDFLRITSFYITWIGGFGVWEDEILLVDDWVAGGETSLWQTKVLLEILSIKSNSVILNKQEVSVQNVEKRDVSYGVYNVFYKNYLELLKGRVDSGDVDQVCYNFLRKDLLLNFFSVWIANYKLNKQGYHISKTEENMEDLVTAEYQHEDYFKCYRYKLRFCLYKQILKRFIKRFIKMWMNLRQSFGNTHSLK